jgi:hypothetical protein
MDEAAIWDAGRLVLACGLYLVVAVVTSRGFIAGPVRRVLTKEVELCLAEVEMRAAKLPDNASVAALTGSPSSPTSTATALFDGIAGTTQPSDFPPSCIPGLPPPAFPEPPTP